MNPPQKHFSRNRGASTKQVPVGSGHAARLAERRALAPDEVKALVLPEADHHKRNN